MSPFTRPLAVAAAVCLLASAVFGQVVGGTIFGRVADESGQPLAGAQGTARYTATGPVSRPARDGAGKPLAGTTVTARNVDTGLTRTVPSDAGGIYRFAQLPVGTYEFTATLGGFATEVRSRGPL